jgi:hypothetical protein
VKETELLIPFTTPMASIELVFKKDTTEQQVLSANGAPIEIGAIEILAIKQ